MTLYAWRTTRKPLPKFLAAGCPASGWVHARGGPPWQVIVFPDLETATKAQGQDRWAAIYIGDEPTVTWDELLPPPARSNARAEMERLHWRDELGPRCPAEYREAVAAEADRELVAVRCPHLFDVLRYEHR